MTYKIYQTFENASFKLLSIHKKSGVCSDSILYSTLTSLYLWYLIIVFMRCCHNLRTIKDGNISSLFGKSSGIESENLNWKDLRVEAKCESRTVCTIHT